MMNLMIGSVLTGKGEYKMSNWDIIGFAPQGWQCPVCRAVYSPMMTMCFNCTGKTVTTTKAPIETTTTVTIKPSSFVTGTRSGDFDGDKFVTTTYAAANSINREKYENGLGTTGKTTPTRSGDDSLQSTADDDHMSEVWKNTMEKNRHNQDV